MVLRFDVEDSAEGTCGTLNGNVQTGNAMADLTLAHAAELKVYIRGMGEPFVSDREQMIVAVDGVPIAVAANVARTVTNECDSRPLVQSVQIPTVLQANTAYAFEVFVTTTTGDLHRGVFFETRFKFRVL